MFILILPFVVLIRGSVYFHGSGCGPYVSLALGLIFTTLLLVLYMTISRGFVAPTLGGWSALKRRVRIAFLMLTGYCFHALFFMSTVHLKNPDLRAEIRDLHPVIRLAVSTVVVIDKKLIITDAARTRSDYIDMGLPVNERSLHYPQKDGYVHAVDLRTRNRSFLRNMLLQGYFRLMGFKTLKHGGTGPHLHISLKRR